MSELARYGPKKTSTSTLLPFFRWLQNERPATWADEAWEFDRCAAMEDET